MIQKKSTTCHCDDMLNNQISVNEVNQVIKGLKTKKAPEIDTIYYALELFRFGLFICRMTCKGKYGHTNQGEKGPFLNRPRLDNDLFTPCIE